MNTSEKNPDGMDRTDADTNNNDLEMMVDALHHIEEDLEKRMVSEKLA